MRALLSILWMCACGSPASPPAPVPAPVPAPLAESASEEPIPAPAQAVPPIAIDTHVDTPQRMLDDGDDIAERLPDGHLDLPRMREGGLSAAFFSVWVDPRDHPGEAGWERALALTRAIRQLPERHPDQAALCTSAAEIRRAHEEGKIAVLIGVEGGHALGEPATEALALERLRELFRLGARYMTITWSNDNVLGHSSGGAHPSRGLTDLGRSVVREMNRLGMIVDVSHVSDRTFWDIAEIAERPLLASHSSARALADHPRNMTDDMIRRVGQGGGAICINFYSQFIDAAYHARRRELERQHASEIAELRREHPGSRGRASAQNAHVRRLDPTLRAPTLETLGAHFQHVAEIAGPSAVCLGSDFDGVSELPEGLDDVSDLPALRAELERRRLPIAAIYGDNVLRVLDAQRGVP